LQVVHWASASLNANIVSPKMHNVVNAISRRCFSIDFKGVPQRSEVCVIERLAHHPYRLQCHIISTAFPHSVVKASASDRQRLILECLVAIVCARPFRAARSPNEAGRMLMELDADRSEKEIAAAGNYLLTRPGSTSKTYGVVGFCMGGALAQYVATKEKSVGATVSFYGSVDRQKG
jgi:hypothetical protein